MRPLVANIARVTGHRKFVTDPAKELDRDSTAQTPGQNKVRRDAESKHLENNSSSGKALSV